MLRIFKRFVRSPVLRDLRIFLVRPRESMQNLGVGHSRLQSAAPSIVYGTGMRLKPIHYRLHVYMRVRDVYDKVLRIRS